MIYRRVQGTDLRVSVIGFGGGRLGSFDSGMTRKGWLRLLEQAFDVGINLYDTASSYALGRSEGILGRFLQGKRDKVIIVTKAGYEVHSFWKILRVLLSHAPGVKSLEKIARRREVQHAFDQWSIRRSIERSLRRLRTDYIDILLLHSLPFLLWDAVEVYQVLQDLKDEGKIRYYGFSTGEIEGFLIKDAPPNISVVGAVLSALDVCRNVRLQDALLSLRRDVIAYHPFGGGRLFRAPDTENDVLREAVQTKIGQNCRGMSRAQLAVVYLLRYRPIVSVVPRFSSWENLSDITRVLHLVEG